MNNLEVSYTERVNTENTQHTKELFLRGKLLARAMEPLRIVKGNIAGSFDLDAEAWETEFDLLKTGQLMSASSTLLKEGKSIPVYKAYGILFDGTKAHIEHVANSDSGSSGAGESFRANESKLKSLDDLVSVIDSQQGNLTMNEVNATFSLDNWEGFFLVKSPRMNRLLVDVIICIALTYKKTGLDKPLFVYDRVTGEMEECVIDSKKTAECFELLREKEKALYIQKLKQVLETDFTSRNNVSL